MSFAVVDLETTGLNPRVDRVIDLCVILLDHSGAVEGEFATLVRVWPPPPGAPGKEYASAPEFADVAGLLASVLADRVLVGHNVNFDLRMLQAEFTRCGLDLVVPSTLDTVTGDRIINPQESGRSLHRLARRMGLNEYSWHTAQGDARATAEIFRIQLEHPAVLSIASAADPVSLRGVWDSGKPILVPRDPMTFPPSTAVSKTEEEVRAAEDARAELRESSEIEPSYRGSGPGAAFTIGLILELPDDARDLIDRIKALPRVQERERLQDQLLEDAGAMGRDEAYELWDEGKFRTKASMELLAQVIETFEIIDDTDELLPAVFMMVRMSSRFHDDKRFRAFTDRFIDIVKKGDDDDTFVTDQASEFLWWLMRRPNELLRVLLQLGPVILRDKDEGVDLLFSSAIHASAEAATAGDLPCALQLLEAAESFASSLEVREELRLASFNAHRSSKSPDAIEVGLELWNQGLHDEDLACWLIDAMFKQGEIDAAMGLGTRALQVCPDSRPLRAAVGRIHRGLNSLRD